MAKNVIRLTESQLKNIIKESVKKVLKEGTETLGDMKDIINTIDVDELIKKGKVEIGDYDIERLSNPMDMVIKIQITNVETGQSAMAKMYSDEYESLSDEHYEVVKMACSEYLKLNGSKGINEVNFHDADFAVNKSITFGVPKYKRELRQLLKKLESNDLTPEERTKIQKRIERLNYKIHQQPKELIKGRNERVGQLSPSQYQNWVDNMTGASVLYNDSIFS